MGCECCKESDPKRYHECQSIIEKIKSMKSSQDWRFRAPCGILYTFSAKYFTKSKKEKRIMEILNYFISFIIGVLFILALLLL